MSNKIKKDSSGNPKLFNLIFPVWLLVWLPSPLWIGIIPINYIIDRLVFTISGKIQKKELKQKFFMKHTWKLFLIGFAADFVGMIMLLLPMTIENWIESRIDGVVDWLAEINSSLSYNCFDNIFALLYTLLAIAVAGLLIYIFDKKVIISTKEFTIQQANKIALFMALFTAPYLYLFPIEYIY
ncbi:MAG: hypothetical protein K5669_11765 [Lachnospiraceae bacterium]|nr:hypothetical protein [Lachnospiraceae bacterium]